MMQRVLVIVGPTASGKSALGLECAKAFSGEIISGDSIAIYRGLDIGSAKASEDERAVIKHHLIDIKEPFENYSVKEFQEKGRELINNISKCGHLPIVVGGTGLYIKALLYDYEFCDEQVEDNQYLELSNQEIYDLLLQKDPVALEKIHINNRKRLVRALNIVEKHNVGISEIKARQEHKLLYDAFIVGLKLPRDVLYQRIDNRVEQMMENGLVAEIEGLLNRGVTFDNQAMQGIGYREFKDYFLGNYSLDSCVEAVKKNTKHFAKRQMTWFNNQMNVKWFDSVDGAREEVEKWLNI